MRRTLPLALLLVLACGPDVATDPTPGTTRDVSSTPSSDSTDTPPTTTTTLDTPSTAGDIGETGDDTTGEEPARRAATLIR